MTRLEKLILKNLINTLLFLLIIVAIFNLLTDFTFKLGISSQVLTKDERINFFALSYILAVFNYLSKSFFGLPIYR